VKLIAIGDIHGRDTWREIVNQDFDKVVFVGDYFDTHEGVSAAQQMYNFRMIVTFKRKNPDKVILLVGNHDFHYMRGIDEEYSGYQLLQKFDIQEIIHNSLDQLQMCYRYENFLFTHAGVTRTWLKSVEYNNEPIEEFINTLFKTTPRAFKFTPGRTYSDYGDDITQTPIWVRPRSLLNDYFGGYTHVVGHTTGKEIVIQQDAIFIDALGKDKYLVIDKEIKEEKIER